VQENARIGDARNASGNDQNPCIFLHAKESARIRGVKMK